MGRFSAGAYRKRRLTVPTVALVGAADAGVRPGMLDVHGDQAHDLIGHLVDDASHFLVDDRPDAVVTHHWNYSDAPSDSPFVRPW